MASIKKLQPNQIVWSIESRKMGNTSIKINNLYRVKIIEVNIEENYVIASWNGNSSRKYFEKSFKKWKVKEPQPKSKVLGNDSY